MMQAEAMDGGDGAREGEEDQNIRRNPFLQGPILEVFFKLLSLEELAKCRLVSKLWYEMSLSAWRSKATIKFEEERIFSTTDDGTRRTTSVGEFLDYWEAREWRSCPFEMFSLQWWTFEARNVEQERFLELVGGHITSLTLEECSFVGLEDSRRIIYQSFPNLKSLKMHSCGVFWHQPWGEILAYKEPAYGVHGLESLHISGFLRPHSMMEMLSHFHKIKSLKVQLEVEEEGLEEDEEEAEEGEEEAEEGEEEAEEGEEEAEEGEEEAEEGEEGQEEDKGEREKEGVDYGDLLEIIRLIRTQDPTKLPLKNFDVKFDFDLGKETASSIQRLKLHEQLNLPLQSFQINLNFDPEEDKDGNYNDVIRDILQNHSSTLKFLGVYGMEEYRHEISKSFPNGIWPAKLEELIIYCGFFDNFNFLMYTPNLRFLSIENESITHSESDNSFSNSSQLEIGDWTLPKLTTLIFDLPVSDCNLRKLLKWTPNLKSVLGISLDAVKLSLICNSWKNLKDVYDYGEELTDEDVIGIGNGPPNITRLQNLTRFTTRSSKLTSASVHDGFLKLANLEFLTLGPSTKFDDEAKAALERRGIGLRICRLLYPNQI